MLAVHCGGRAGARPGYTGSVWIQAPLVGLLWSSWYPLVDKRSRGYGVDGRAEEGAGRMDDGRARWKGYGEEGQCAQSTNCTSTTSFEVSRFIETIIITDRLSCIRSAVSNYLSTAFAEIILDDQDLFALKDRWEELLKLLPLGKPRNDLQEEWEMDSERASADKWQDLKDIALNAKEKDKVCIYGLFLSSALWC
jgi:hypothetical protein